MANQAMAAQRPCQAGADGGLVLGLDQPRERHHDHEFRQRQQFGDHPMGSHDQGGGERHEITGDMGGGQPLQTEELGGFDEAALKAQEAAIALLWAEPAVGS